MKTYRTAELAGLVGVHPNTVRLYEQWELIPAAQRQKNGYRVFTDFHLRQFRLARTAFQIEVLQNGLRKKIIETVKLSAKGDFDGAINSAEEYAAQLRLEQDNAREAIEIVRGILSGGQERSNLCLKRKEAAEYLGVTMDTLRNWEMNGLLTVKRRRNGYRVYTAEDISRLKIIRSLRCANYSLEAILRMLSRISDDPEADLEAALNTPGEGEDIISACDRLIASLKAAEENAGVILRQLHEMKKEF